LGLEGDIDDALVDLRRAGALEKDFELRAGFGPVALIIGGALRVGEEAVVALVVEFCALQGGWVDLWVEEVGGTCADIVAGAFDAGGVEDVELDGVVGVGDFVGEVGVLPAGVEA
jgi:hypothetical protein